MFFVCFGKSFESKLQMWFYLMYFGKHPFKNKGIFLESRDYMSMFVAASVKMAKKVEATQLFMDGWIDKTNVA